MSRHAQRAVVVSAPYLQMTTQALQFRSSESKAKTEVRDQTLAGHWEVAMSYDSERAARQTAQRNQQELQKPG